VFLKEFAITRYGPLSGGDVKQPAPFTLFFAPNEEGKTLTIDAILKMMFSNRELKPVAGVSRVEEKPEGYLVVGTGQKNYKLPEAGRFSSLLEISALEFRNIFLIRDSDLALSGEEEFFRAVTGRLTGMRVDEIKNLRDNLQELGGVTAGGDFSNAAPGKLKDRYTRGKTLLSEIETFLEELKAENFSSFEESLAWLEERRGEIKVLLENYDRAYNREHYERGREAVSALRDALDRLGKLEGFNRDDYEAWQRAEMNRSFMRSEIERLEKEAHEKQEQLQEAQEQRDFYRGNLMEIEHTSRKINEEIEPALEKYNHLEGTCKKEDALLTTPFINGTAVISVLAFLMSLGGYVITTDWWLLPILFGSLAILLVYGFFRFRSAQRQAALGRIESEACAEAEKLDLSACDISTVRSAVGRVNRNLELAHEALEKADSEGRWLEKEVGRLKEDIREREKRVGQEGSRISEISFSGGVESLAQYNKRLEEKDALQGEIEKQKSILLSLFSPDDENYTLEELLFHWDEQISRLENFAGAAPDLRYDRSTIEQLKQELEQTDTEIERLRKKRSWRGDQLRSLEKDVNALLQDEEGYLPCQTVVDLEVAGSKVSQWLERQEHQREKALAAIAVVDSVAAAEEQKVNDLFGTGKPASDYFKTITGGRYREVVFDGAENRVKVMTEEGLLLDAGSLSGGAYDQLYFSIRLALAESLLRGGKGFLILDDPFIKADAERLQKLLGMLDHLSRKGWQIIYFSAKEEIKTALEDEIAAGRVQLSVI